MHQFELQVEQCICSFIRQRRNNKVRFNYSYRAQNPQSDWAIVKRNKRFHNGKFLEDMKVTVFEGSTEDIIAKVKESDSNLFKVAIVENIGMFQKLIRAVLGHFEP